MWYAQYLHSVSCPAQCVLVSRVSAVCSRVLCPVSAAGVYTYVWCARIYMHRFPRMYILTPQKTSKKNFADSIYSQNENNRDGSNFAIENP